MKIGNKDFNRNHTHIMGILNITPDSFSDGGNYNSIDAALYQAEKMITDGADLLDIGGESTRPGYDMITPQEEIDRILPVISAIKARLDIPISVDTYKSQVAEMAISAGADMINDIWGLKHDSGMGSIIAKAGIPVCIMHNRKENNYIDLIKDVLNDLNESISIALSAGISSDNIILDPGIGFAKNYEENLALINRFDELHQSGYPLLLGASRKSVIGNALNLPIEERLEGTLATTAVAYMKGAMFVRVHDVKENYRFVQMLNKIKAEH